MSNFKGYEINNELMENYKAAVKFPITNLADEKGVERAFDAMNELETQLRIKYGMSREDINELYEAIMNGAV